MNKSKFKTFSIVLLLFGIFIISNLSAFGQQTPVQKLGQLKIDGKYIVDQNNKPVQLAGMSFFWSQWIGKYYNYDCIKWLKDDWHCSVVRAAMAVGPGGYSQHPDLEMKKIETVIDAAIDLGIYVVVDFHEHNAEKYLSEALTFFGAISKKYGNYPNIIYEIYNEPLRVSWSEVIKPYSEAVIAAIRKNDPDNIIVCGTPLWSQRVDDASIDPIKSENIAYSLHFYAGTHKKELMKTGDIAIKNGICLFVTEYGTTEANGDGLVYEKETNQWYKWMDKHKISHCNWSVSDKKEASSILVENADSTGGWTPNQIKPSGKLVKLELHKKYKELMK